MEEIDRIVFLLKKHLADKQRFSEDEELIALFRQYPFLKDIIEELKTEKELKAALQEYSLFSKDSINSSERRMWDAIHSEIRSTDGFNVRKTFPYWKYVSAACILLVAFFTYWTLRVNEAHTAEQLRAITSQLSPGTNKATLQLADGQLIELSSEHQGVVVGQDLSYDDGSVLIGGLADKQIDLVLSTPRGGQYQIVLPDGTKVWMNADSKLVYPNIFLGNKREVRLEGEAYFEVAENKEKPFIVHTGTESVEVLGTHFNVNAYTGEAASHVSLLEGSVKVVLPNNQETIIQPGQQSITRDNKLSVQTINIDEVVAWKDGEFMFNNESLESVMRKIARWYDLEIEVSPELRDITIWGSISREDDFSKVLEVIQMTNENIRFKVEERRVQLMK